MSDSIRLTRFSHGGGCGCKIAPAVLERILAEVPRHALPYPDLLVGLENGDDAAVYRVGGGMAVIATTDFFMPIVDDPFDFGRIAAANAISDVYAMGGRPIFALAVLAMPIDKLPDSVIRDILRGGMAVCEAAGIPLAGGHSIDSVEPIFGLVALGLVEESRLRRNDTARAGDALVLGKPLGIGVLSAALKKDDLSAEGYKRMIELTTQLNTAGPRLAEMDAVHAITDVTGFALLGHLIEVCRGSRLGAELSAGAVPLITGVRDLAQRGFVTGASKRNWGSYGAFIDLDPALPAWHKDVLTDPQTSGGLLVACAPKAVNDVLTIFRAEGFVEAAVIGRMVEGPARVRVNP